ncbi:MAG TPA: LamG-like jellyroll fold domain-containing protein, partial [Verrucomicrobiae bacterium]
MKKIVAVFGAVCMALGQVYAQGSASCDPAPSGMVGWWKGDGNGNDNVGADNATVPTGVTYTPGEVALGFNLNGNYDDTNRILVPDAPQLNFGPNKDFSVEAWIQPLSNPGNYTDLSGEVMTVVGKRYAPSFYTAWGYEMYLGNGRLCFQLIDSLNHGGNFYNLGVEPDLRDGEFHHVAVTVQRNSTTGLRFYVDGQLIATFDPTAVQGDLSSTSPLRIGNHPTPGVKAFYHGVIDEVSLYNRALSSNEIAAIYNAGSAGKCPVPPTILVQPTNQTVAVGGTATFRVSAYGTPPLFYQWSFNGTYIPGA